MTGKLTKDEIELLLELLKLLKDTSDDKIIKDHAKGLIIKILGI